MSCFEGYFTTLENGKYPLRIMAIRTPLPTMPITIPPCINTGKYHRFPIPSGFLPLSSSLD